MALLSFLRLDKPKSPSFIFQPSSTKISARKVSNYLAKKGNIKHSLDGFKSPCMMGGSWVCKKLSPRAMLRPICNFCCSSSTSCVLRWVWVRGRGQRIIPFCPWGVLQDCLGPYILLLLPTQELSLPHLRSVSVSVSECECECEYNGAAYPRMWECWDVSFRSWLLPPCGSPTWHLRAASVCGVSTDLENLLVPFRKLKKKQ